MAGGIDDLLQCLYTLDGTEYKVSIPIHIKTGIAAPELTELNVVRTDGGLEASFESNCAGTYAYAVLGEGDAVPTDWSGYTRYEMTQGSNSFTISDAPARDAKLCVMAWNGKDEPLAQCAETAIPDYAYSLEEGFKALTETTQLPYNDQVNLGGEGSSLYAWEGKQVYGKLLRVELKEEDQLNLVFGDSGQALNTIIEVYRETSDGFSCVGSYWAGYGVSRRYLPEEAGTYYLAFLGYDKNQTGPCSLEASISPAPEVMPLEEGLRALTETTQLPYSTQVNLGGQDTVLYRQGEGFDS